MIKVSEYNLKTKFFNFFKLDVIQELILAGIGCLFLLFIYRLFPNRFWDEKARNTICSLIILSFFIVYLILNQPNSNRNFFKVNYKRNIILFTILNFGG
jgi:hypothetical protein